MYRTAVPWYFAAALPQMDEATLLACSAPSPLLEVGRGEDRLGAICHIVADGAAQHHDVGLRPSLQGLCGSLLNMFRIVLVAP